MTLANSANRPSIFGHFTSRFIATIQLTADLRPQWMMARKLAYVLLVGPYGIYCDELAWGLAIAACIPVLLAAALSRQTLAHSDCYTTNETY